MNSEIKKFLVSCILATLTLLVPPFLGNNLIVSVVLLFLIGLLMLSLDWNAKNIVYYLAIFIIGSLAESPAIRLGAWTYAHPIIIGVPL
jgi:hypothetical protein